MNTKVLLIPICIGVFALAGCGKNDQQAPSGVQDNVVSTKNPAASEVTMAVAEDKIQPLGSDVLAAAQSTNAACSLDSVDENYFKGQVKLTSGRSHVFRGWLLDETRHPAGNFSFVLKGMHNYAISAKTGVVRNDVGDYFKDPTLSDAGFNFSTTLTSISAGEYRVTFVIQRDQKAYFCDSGKTFTVE